MAKHEFGGNWTEDKLDRVRKYLEAYTKIFNTNPRARYFTTWYVDAFAGTGQRTEREVVPHNSLFEDERDEDAEALRNGSARIALDVSPGFDQYLFIESRADRVSDLEAMKGDFPDKARSIEAAKADANEYLQRWCSEVDWNRNRAVVFLDPYGTQVKWTTIETIAGTKAIDLWVLFPLGVAVNRLLTRKEAPPVAWADTLTRLFGTEVWKQRFYRKQQQETLFGIEETEVKWGGLADIADFFVERLESIFTRVAKPRRMFNSTNTPIYLLCFAAAGNAKVARTAVKIAQDILLKE